MFSRVISRGKKYGQARVAPLVAGEEGADIVSSKATNCLGSIQVDNLQPNFNLSEPRTVHSLEIHDMTR